MFGERNQQLREVVGHLQKAVGQVERDSELGKWLAWATGHVDRSDPFRRFRERRGAILALYYYGYDRDRVRQDGFTEPPHTGYGNEKPKPGVELTCRPPRLTAWERALQVELTEDMVLPYEWRLS